MFYVPSSLSTSTEIEISPASPMSLKLTEAVFASVPHVVPSTGKAIEIATVAPVWCEECSLFATPIPLSDSALGWILHPCHETECSDCYNAGSLCTEDKCEECCSCVTCQYCGRTGDQEMCSNCEYCDPDYTNGCGGCECSQCSSCGQVKAGLLCDHCGHCSCESCRSEAAAAEEEENYSSVTPGWISRGDVLPTDVPLYDVGGSLTEEAKGRNDHPGVDPAQAMADFYVSDFVMATLRKAFRNGMSVNNAGTRTAQILWQQAKALQDFHIARCDGIFRDYVFAAVGGEIRHHVNVRGTTPGGRESMWDFWHHLGEKIGRTALLADAVEIFGCDSWSGSYGGPKWQTIARTALQRETGELDARTFVDRVFSMQHNGGSLLNKISWKIRNDRSYSTGEMAYIGDAHAADEIGWETLWSVASDDARSLLVTLVGGFLYTLPAYDRMALLLIRSRYIATEES